ncbi:SDR family NAD(P)-dependent oxidoreductase [Ktedonosporobacter rubrisoli]|uniref:SDR family NAD(P)-dependent oxidoreductase n=1 Tax=Ktedonosporobacter rubrisoli TaxID=2509675 RepID=A0A4P6JLV6_KTERU|nr:SDR family NAD(P)-dependent oxidoreductase [Ktedonosporobacter rubrisoli]QBD75646.1 SDR family NAD(P)-dependent oxidoreductase [Ktedonosporobacter rubrisoli]
MGSLAGRVAIITGAGQGIGREHALFFASEGAKVVVNDPGVAVDGSGGDSSLAQRVVDEIRAAGGEAVANTDSVADWQGAQRLIRSAVEAFGDLHVVVNNAGILRNELLLNMSEQEFDTVIAVHLKGTFAVSHWAALYWREQSRAHPQVDRAIVNTSSGSGLHNPLPTEVNYAAAKAGVAAMTIVAAIELQPYHVRVNCIAPSRARTRATVDLPGIGGATQDGQFDPFHPGNVSPVVAYLCMADCPFNGQVFSLHGGTVIRYHGWSLGEEIRSDQRWSIYDLTRAMQTLPNPDPLANLLSALGVLGPEAQEQMRHMIEASLTKER